MIRPTGAFGFMVLMAGMLLALLFPVGLVVRNPTLARVYLALAFLPLILGVGGTVMGMIRTFSATAHDPAADAQDLSAGITVSLTTTAMGLAVTVLAGIAALILLRISGGEEEDPFDTAGPS
jgi:hypothetical protein